MAEDTSTDEIDSSEFKEQQNFVSLEQLRQLQMKEGKTPTPVAADKPPDPFPSNRTKEQLFDADKYESAAELVAKILPTKGDTWETFTETLMQECRCSTALDKVRVAFEWVGRADPDKAKDAKDRKRDSPLDILIRCRQEKLFSALFQRIIAHAGVVYTLIRGYKKGTSYKLGHRIHGTRDRGLWFAVLIDGEWRFVDAHWGCCHVSGENSGEWNKISEKGSVEKVPKSKGTIVYTCTETYFLTDAWKMIFKHFPEDPAWQLLPKPLTQEQFEQLPYMFPELMEAHGLSLVSHKKSVIVVPDNGRVEIELQQSGPERRYNRMLHIHSSSIGKEDKVMFDGKKVDLARFVAVKYETPRLLIDMALPLEGKYLLVLQGQGDSRVDLIHWVLRCSNRARDAEPLPEPQTGGFGAEAVDFGVRSVSHSGAAIHLPDGEDALRLRANAHLQYRCKLRNADSQTVAEPIFWDDAEEKRDTGEDGDNGESSFDATVQVVAPKEGKFGLAIYARPHGSDREWQPVREYLVTADRPATGVDDPMPSMELLGRLGWLDDDARKRMGPERPGPPYLRTEEAEVTVPWRHAAGERLSAELYFYNVQSLVRWDEFLFADGAEHGTDFQLRFKKPGCHLLKIFADGKPVYALLVRCCNEELDGGAVQYPQRLSGWRHPHRLVEPRDLLLPPGDGDSTLRARLDASVRDAQLRAGDRRLPMRRGADGVWYGDLPPGERGDVFKLLGVESDGTEAQLLEFRVATEDDERQLAADKEDGRKQEQEQKQKQQQKQQQQQQQKQQQQQQQQQQQEGDGKEVAGVAGAAEGSRSRSRSRSRSSEREADSRSRSRSGSRSRSSSEKSRSPSPDQKPTPKERRALRKYCRSQLYSAMRSKRLRQMEKALGDWEKNDFSKDDELYVYCRSFYRMLQLKQKLNKSVTEAKQKRNKDCIGKVLKEIDEEFFAEDILAELNEDLRRAVSVYNRFDRIQKIRIEPLKLDEKTKLELSNYPYPTFDVHATVMATLLLMGFYEKRTRKWKRCQPIVKTLKVEEFNRLDPAGVHLSIALRSQELLSDLDINEVALKSAAAAAFFDWAMNVVKAVGEMNEDDESDKKPKPAGIRRQKKILKISAEEDADLDWEDEGKRAPTGKGRRSRKA